MKHIEKRLGIGRSEDTEGLRGLDAIRLWREYEAGSEEALTLLARYNAEDVRNLRPLLAFACHGLRQARWQAATAIGDAAVPGEG